jgi:hypothetical protein
MEEFGLETRTAYFLRANRERAGALRQDRPAVGGETEMVSGGLGEEMAVMGI